MGEQFSFGGADGGLQLIEASKGDMVASSSFHDTELRSVRFLTETDRFLSVDRRGRTGIWTPGALEMVDSLEYSASDGAFPSGTALSPDGRRLALGENDGTVTVFSSLDGFLLWTKDDPHDALVEDLAFSADGRWLATGDSRGRLAIWDVAEAALLEDLGEVETEIMTLSFAPTSAVLVAGGGPGVDQRSIPLITTDLSTTTLLGRACELLTDRLTPADWTQLCSLR